MYKGKKYIQVFKRKLSNGGTVSPEELQVFFSRLEEDLKDKKYGLVWESQTEKVIEELKTNKVYLQEEQDLKITQDPDNPKSNILIEGDNYEALTYLNEINQKVDVIYIDPPYNTGNKNFIYNDRFIDKEDGFRHSQWLSFMDARLRLARELLTDDGVIFISIDDNEVFQLKLLCDEVFGENNFVANMVVENNPKGRKNSKHVVYTHEYMLAYARNKETLQHFEHVLMKRDSGKTYEDDKGAYKQGRRVLAGHDSNPVMKNKNSRKNYDVLYDKRESLIVKIERDAKGVYTDKNIIPGHTEYVIYENKNREGVANYATYTWDKLQELFEQDDLIFKDKTIYEKDRNVATKIKSVLHKENLNGVNIITETAGQRLAEIMEGGVFSFPKSVNLIKLVVQSFPNKNAIVLDFFAGSGTTGQAVLELNKEDGGNRQFILVNSNENNIARDVTYERNKRVIEGYTTPKGKDITGIPANLAYYKTKQVSKYDEEASQLEDELSLL